MSCRAIGRTVEECLMNEVVQRARHLGYQKLIGEFIPTAKNELVAEFYSHVGFVPSIGEDDNVARFELALNQCQPCQSHVRA